jgi:hypothetical protein
MGAGATVEFALSRSPSVPHTPPLNSVTMALYVHEEAIDHERHRLIHPEISSNHTRTTMQACEVCGNEYDKAFQVTMNGSTHTFDSFECAIHMLAPRCEHCDVRVVGHGLESDGRVFCCNHCAETVGEHAFTDRA